MAAKLPLKLKVFGAVQPLSALMSVPHIHLQPDIWNVKSDFNFYF